MSVPDGYSGKRVVLYSALLAHDPYDQFGWCQEWRFAICDYLVWVVGTSVPDFKPSPVGPDRDSYVYEQLCAERPDAEALWYVLRILDRYREWLRLAGKDY